MSLAEYVLLEAPLVNADSEVLFWKTDQAFEILDLTFEWLRFST
jgi:hypothetical protein